MNSERPPCEFVLSVCIPTYNRCGKVVALVQAILGVSEEVEVCVHVDGSNDGTLEALRGLAVGNDRLKVSYAQNSGRAHALPAAIRLATAQYCMIYDDDDDIYEDSVRQLITILKQPLPLGVCGYICHMNSDAGVRIGADFPVERSNFLKLRLEQGVTGDKKEIALTRLIKSAAHEPNRRIRRSPTSLIWRRLAIHYDVICLDLTLGVKHYMADGITKNIASIKRQNARPLQDLHILNLYGFLRGRHRSVRSVLRDVVATAFYGFLCIVRPTPVKP